MGLIQLSTRYRFQFTRQGGLEAGSSGVAQTTSRMTSLAMTLPTRIPMTTPEQVHAFSLSLSLSLSLSFFLSLTHTLLHPHPHPDEPDDFTREDFTDPDPDDYAGAGTTPITAEQVAPPPSEVLRNSRV